MKNNLPARGVVGRYCSKVRRTVYGHVGLLLIRKAAAIVVTFTIHFIHVFETKLFLDSLSVSFLYVALVLLMNQVFLRWEMNIFFSRNEK